MNQFLSDEPITHENGLGAAWVARLQHKPVRERMTRINAARALLADGEDSMSTALYGELLCYVEVAEADDLRQARSYNAREIALAYLERITSQLQEISEHAGELGLGTRQWADCPDTYPVMTATVES